MKKQICKNLLTLDDVIEKLDLTSEDKKAIQIEMDIIDATIQARKASNLTQKQLSEKSGLAQPVIARIETRKRSPQLSTIIKMLYPMGYTLKIVPISKSK